ncbi:hypothetical protein [Streptomyces sp. HUAS CX7]|uniref:hypothetical protein n=1 Tax=Streptomyces sp. HUAS CX7 TaxID=3062782 RepID=UPI0026EDB3FE|nr:hypothetical protein [Streptomyces sp. HUAS CX7]WKX23275.1 hypothetical protein Q3Y68_36585 [Streptomyces sp. HUAS CX7]
MTVRRCLHGASRPARRISSITGLYGSTTAARGGSFLRGSGQAESSAFQTVRHVTPCVRSSSRIDMPPRWSRRIAAYNSTFDICGMTSTFHQEHPDAALARDPVPPELIEKRHHHWVPAQILGSDHGS